VDFINQVPIKYKKVDFLLSIFLTFLIQENKQVGLMNQIPTNFLNLTIDENS